MKKLETGQRIALNMEWSDEMVYLRVETFNSTIPVDSLMESRCMNMVRQNTLFLDRYFVVQR